MHDFIFDQGMDGLIKRTCIKIIAIASSTTKGINYKKNQLKSRHPKTISSDIFE